MPLGPFFCFHWLKRPLISLSFEDMFLFSSLAFTLTDAEIFFFVPPDMRLLLLGNSCVLKLGSAKSSNRSDSSKLRFGADFEKALNSLLESLTTPRSKDPAESGDNPHGCFSSDRDVVIAARTIWPQAAFTLLALFSYGRHIPYNRFHIYREAKLTTSTKLQRRKK